jgi:hypothetical protein
MSVLKRACDLQEVDLLMLLYMFTQLNGEKSIIHLIFLIDTNEHLLITDYCYCVV